MLVQTLKCRESPVKIIKTIRFTGYVRNIPEEVKGNVKVIRILCCDCAVTVL